MKIFLSDQLKKLSIHLDFLKSRPIINYDKNKLTEKVTTEIITEEFDNLDLQFLFDYSIFPDNIMTYLTQWKVEKRKMMVGDTIVQQIYLPPIKKLSQKVIFGVRITEIIDQPNKKGFSYETLKGHVEKGISTFTIEREKKTTIFKIHTFSEPGNLLTKLLGPIFSVPYQTFCTKKAIKNVKHQIEK